MVFQYTPAPSLQNANTTYPLQLTEAAWRAQLAKWYADVDMIEAKCLGGIDSEYVNVPDGLYWIGSSQGSFNPGSQSQVSANELTSATEGGADPSA